MIQQKVRANLAKKIHETAQEKGWWDKQRNRKEMFMLIVTELAEAVEADRENQWATESDVSDVNLIMNSDSTIVGTFKSVFEARIKGTVEVELADAWIRCADYLYSRSRENFIIPEFKHMFEENFASCMLDITKEVAERNIPAVTYLIELFCKQHNIDLVWFIETKMKYNDQRERMHGGKKY